MVKADAHFVAVDQLRIGLYIYIDLPWFRHPFTLNSFTIRNEQQLSELRALGVTQFRYDPAQSDATPGQVIEEVPAPVETPDPAIAVTSQDDDPILAEKRKRIERISAYARKTEQVEKAFLKAAVIMRNINRNLTSRPAETVEEMGQLVNQMVAAFLESPEVTLHVMGEKCGGDDMHFHGLNVSILAMMLAKDLDLSPDQARLLGAGALVHDIGLTEIPDRVLKKRPEEYTKPELELRAMHVDYGLRIGKQAGLSPEVLAVIYQHHELADGSGYPRGLKAEAITQLARIVSVTNYYDNLCNPMDMLQAMTPHEALSHMFTQKRSKFDQKILQLMIRCLGVYPPGSIVNLSNDATALVISVNPKKPLRPWIMLYDEAVPKTEAILLDLEQEKEINITKAIRPALLAPPVYAYLSPRKRVTYYFSSDGKPSP